MRANVDPALLTRPYTTPASIESNTEAFEWLMRALLELPSRPAVINTQVFGLAYPLLSTGGDLHTAVSEYYGASRGLAKSPS